MTKKDERPTFQTERLVLRPFTLADATDVRRLAGERDVAATVANMPHPYEEGMAEEWISTHAERFERGEGGCFAVTLRQDKTLVGSMGLTVNAEHERGTIGYWIGKPFWNNGYCTEAAGAVLRYAFEQLGLNRITANHFKRNPASGRVMQKIGMRQEGCLLQEFKKWGQFEDVVCYGIIKSEYEAQ